MQMPLRACISVLLYTGSILLLGFATDSRALLLVNAKVLVPSLRCCQVLVAIAARPVGVYVTL